MDERRAIRTDATYIHSPLCILGRGPLVVVMPLPARLEELHLCVVDHGRQLDLDPFALPGAQGEELTHLILARSPILLLEIAIGHLGILV